MLEYEPATLSLLRRFHLLRWIDAHHVVLVRCILNVTVTRAAHDRWPELLCFVALLHLRERTFVSQSALALREPGRLALPSWCFRERTEFPQRIHGQSAIRSDQERDELETHSNRAEIFDKLFARS